MQQRRRTDREHAAVATQRVLGEPVQLAVQDREEAIDGNAVGVVGALDQ